VLAAFAPFFGELNLLLIPFAIVGVVRIRNRDWNGP
jgi:hypothetical protein